MPLDPRREVEALNEAVDALLEGATAEQATVGASADLEALIRSGQRLRNGAAGATDAPRPSFVLGLEEQLRTDLRILGQSVASEAGLESTSAEVGGAPGAALGLARSPNPIGVPGVRPEAWRLTVLLALLVGLAGMWIAAERAMPGDPLYALKRRGEGLEIAMASGPAAESRAYFRVGRRRLAEVGVLAAEPAGFRELDALLDDLLALYSRGVAAAVRADDPMTLVSARVEVRTAEVELEGMLDNAPVHEQPGAGAQIGDARGALLRLLEPVEAADQRTSPGTASPAATSAATAVAIAGNPATPTSVAPTAESSAETPRLPTATLPPSPTDVVPPPTAPTARATTAPTATAALTPEAPSPSAEPTRTPGRRPRPEPSDTATPAPSPSVTPDVNAPSATPTKDRWPTETPTARPTQQTPDRPAPSASPPPGSTPHAGVGVTVTAPADGTPTRPPEGTATPSRDRDRAPAPRGQ